MLMIVAAGGPLLVPGVTMGMMMLMVMVVIVLMSIMPVMVPAMAVVVVVAGVLLSASRLERARYIRHAAALPAGQLGQGGIVLHVDHVEFEF